MLFTDFQQLLRDHMSINGLNPYRAAVENGLPERAIKSVLEGTKPNFERIADICQALGLQFSIAPQGREPFKPDMHEPSLSSTAWNISEDTERQWPQGQSDIPFIGAIAAGGTDTPHESRISSIEDDQTIRLKMRFPPDVLRKNGGLCAARVQGESMSPTFKDGDIVMFYRDDPAGFQPEKLIGRECAILLEDEDGIVLKRLRRADSGRKDEWNLESLNAHWPTESNVRIRNVSPIRYVQVNL